MTTQGPEDWDDGSNYQPNSGPPNPNQSSPPPPPPPPPGYSQPPAPMPGYGQPQPTGQDSKSVAALATGILAVLLSIFCALLSIPLGIAAIVLGVQGRKGMRAQGRPAGMATTGLALGIFALVLVIGLWVVLAALSSTSS
ncbi:MAG: DUF4190 domain-containing protein [Candidatus Nanopelagicales bacterium]|nr:DUF4190 domain-containing protein [Candidatus Nanopelagicales bacterium]MCU0297131.1 DUF4190 domain-containing protein [Candidatus Nanopelagicales bacterium]